MNGTKETLDLSSLTNKELEDILHDEILFYTEDLDELVHIIRKQLPRKYMYRLIGKLYRKRQ